MSQHTPGPWQVLDGAVLSEGLNDYGNWIVANIDRERTPQDEANLSLIAAAPDMLAALEAFLTMPYPTVGQEMSYRTAQDIQAFRNVARAAIEKAKAKTN